MTLTPKNTARIEQLIKDFGKSATAVQRWAIQEADANAQEHFEQERAALQENLAMYFSLVKKLEEEKRALEQKHEKELLRQHEQFLEEQGKAFDLSLELEEVKSNLRFSVNAAADLKTKMREQVAHVLDEMKGMVGNPKENPYPTWQDERNAEPINDVLEILKEKVLAVLEGDGAG